MDERGQPDGEPAGVGGESSETPAGGWQPSSNSAVRDLNGSKSDNTRRAPGVRTADTPWSDPSAPVEPTAEPASTGWRRSLTSGLRGRAEVRSRYADLLAPVSPAVPPTSPPPTSAPPPSPQEGELAAERPASRIWALPGRPRPPAPDDRPAPPGEYEPAYQPYQPSGALTDSTFDDLPALAQAAAASQAAKAAQAAAQAASAVQAARAAEAAAEAQAVAEDHAAVEAAYRAAVVNQGGNGSVVSPNGDQRGGQSGASTGFRPPAQPTGYRPPAQPPTDFRTAASASPDPRVPGDAPAEFRAPAGSPGEYRLPLPLPPPNGFRSPAQPADGRPPFPGQPAGTQAHPSGEPAGPPSSVAEPRRQPEHGPAEALRHRAPPSEPARATPDGYPPGGRAIVPVGVRSVAAPTSGAPVEPLRGTAPPLPQRIPAPPDVPEVPDEYEEYEPGGFFVEPEEPVRSGLAPPELARIATHLRDEEAEEEATERPDGFDVNTVLAAVRLVPGVRDAQLRPNPGGVHTLRLDLADGADPGQVSRLVARLLKQKMGLAAEPRRQNSPRTPPRIARDPGLPKDAPIASAPPAPRVSPSTGSTEQFGGAAGAQAPSQVDERSRHRVTPGRGRDGPGDGEPRRVVRSLAATPRIVIDQVQVSTLGLEATVEVRLTSNGAPAFGVASGPAVDGYVLRLAAVAATSAIDQLMTSVEGGDRQGRSFVEHAAVVPFGTCEVAVVVILLVYGGSVEQLTGAALVAGDPRQAIVRATLAAVNRRLDAL